MNTFENRIAPQSIKPGLMTRRLRGLWVPIAAVLVLTAWPAFAEEPDDVYLRIMTTLQQADMLAANNQPDKALSKYKEVRGALEKFRITYPDTDAKAVTYRLNYASERIKTLSDASSSSSSGGSATAKAGASEIKLLDAGAEPRAALRLHPKPDDKQSLSLAMKMNMSMKMGEMPEQSTKLPAMTLAMDTTVKSVADNGDITYEVLLGDTTIGDDPDAMPAVTQALKSTFGKVKGMSGTTTISSRGVIKSTEMRMPADTDAQAKQVMDQMKDSFSQAVAQFPEEPVGVGAKWSVKMPMKSQGMTSTQTTTYELASMEGDHLGAKVTIAQSAEKQKIQNPAMPGLKMDLNKMTGNGTGDMTLDLAHLLPPQATIDSHSEMDMGMEVGGQKQTMNMVVDTNIQMESK